MHQMYDIQKFRQNCKNSQDILKTHLRCQQIQLQSTDAVELIDGIQIKTEECTVAGFENVESFVECTLETKVISID